jgi:serine/threonine-protein kinase SRPK3
VGNADPNHLGHGHIVALLDNFVHKGPNGEHLCLVMELLGESLASVRGRLEGSRFPISMVRIIARQTLLGLQYLHESCGVIHTGISLRTGHVHMDRSSTKQHFDGD